MSATTPWWGSGLFSIAGTLLGSACTLVISLLNRRSERHRLSRAQKETDYPDLTAAADTLARLPVWPSDSDQPQDRYEQLHALAQRVAFFGPAKVSRTLPEVLAAADELAETITEIRTNSRPVHNNGIDQRHADRHAAAVTRLQNAADDFTSAARADLEIRTHYAPVRPAPEANAD